MVGILVLALVALAGCGGGDGDDRRPGEPTGPTSTVAVPGATPEPLTVQTGRDAWIDVAVATLWAEPDQARPFDAPSLANPVDIPAWLAAMTLDDRRWLVDRLVTQALYGDRVTVVDTAGDWAKVVVPRQPSKLDPRGYPGWLPSAQLTAVAPGAAAAGEAVVNVPATGLLGLAEPDRPPLTLSFNTRLPVLLAGPESVTVALPGGGRGLLVPSNVDIVTPVDPPPTGDDIVRSAQQFSGVDYLWAGTWPPDGTAPASHRPPMPPTGSSSPGTPTTRPRRARQSSRTTSDPVTCSSMAPTRSRTWPCTSVRDA